MIRLCSPQNLGRVALAATLLCVLVYFYSPGFGDVILSHRPPFPKPCSDCLASHNVVVVVKTGASEAAERVKVQTETSLRWAENILYFSDLEQDLGRIHLYDSLDTVAPAVQDNNPDFDLYRAQKELWQKEHNLTALKDAKHPNNPDELAAWTLDKYKNVHILEKTWALMPDKDWYIFIDADTYVVGSTVLPWLATLDPRRKTYLGSEVMFNDKTFAHGGSGYILSHATMYEYAVAQAGTAARWEPRIHDECCGDFVVGQAVQEQGSKIQGVWPLITGETPWTMPFGAEYWCHPQFTLHHMSPKDMQSLAAFEQERTGEHVSFGLVGHTKGLQLTLHSQYLTPAELFQSFLFKTVPAVWLNWDNLAWDKGEYGHDGGAEHNVATFDECATKCSEDQDCLMYHHNGVTCYLASAMRYGKARGIENGHVFQSGWNQTRIKNWIERQGPCTDPTFPTQKYGR